MIHHAFRIGCVAMSTSRSNATARSAAGTTFGGDTSGPGEPAAGAVEYGTGVVPEPPVPGTGCTPDPVAERNLFAVGDQIVRHPARLRAFAAIGAASAERFAGETLAGVSDA